MAAAASGQMTQDVYFHEFVLPHLLEGAKDLQGQVIAYLNIDSIPGDSTDENFSKQIPVLSMYMNINQSGMVGPGSPGITATGTSTHAPLYCLVRAGSHSPKCALSASQANQANISKATLSFPRLGKTYAQLTLDNSVSMCHFSLHSVGTSNQPELMNVVGLVYGQYELKVSPQDDKGNVGSPQTTKFNVTKNTKG